MVIVSMNHCKQCEEAECWADCCEEANRIYADASLFFNALLDAALVHPEERLGQIICNALGTPADERCWQVVKALNDDLTAALNKYALPTIGDDPPGFCGEPND